MWFELNQSIGATKQTGENNSLLCPSGSYNVKHELLKGKWEVLGVLKKYDLDGENIIWNKP